MHTSAAQDTKTIGQQDLHGPAGARVPHPARRCPDTALLHVGLSGAPEFAGLEKNRRRSEGLRARRRAIS